MKHNTKRENYSCEIVKLAKIGLITNNPVHSKTGFRMAEAYGASCGGCGSGCGGN